MITPPCCLLTQVLEESMLVLAEVESLICTSLGLPVGSPLHVHSTDMIHRVPAPLLQTLEGTMQVPMLACVCLCGTCSHACC